MNNLIKDLANCERPYEKALLHGINALSDAELLAVIIRNGTKDKSSIDLANTILNAHNIHKGIAALNFLTREELNKIKGIGDIKATQLLAIAELSNRMSNTRLKKELSFNNPVTIADYYINKCKFMTKEKTFIMLFTSSHTLIKEIMISEGTINQALVSPREIFIEALKYEAVYIILVHNHPSGSPEPSLADIDATKKIIEAGRILDIRLTDHIIIGDNCYVSMLERGIIQ